MDWSWLLVLACPLMMILMMFGMRGHGHTHGSHSKHPTEDHREIQDELHALKAQNEQMKQEIQKLSRQSNSGA